MAPLRGLQPSNLKVGFGGTVGPTNPVEEVSWTDCQRVLARLRLELPSEAQWEFACRGGTTSAWWTGSGLGNLVGKVNVAGRAYVRVGGPAALTADWPEFDDGFGVHHPVGRLAVNPYGLHEVHGNIGEWCFDAYLGYDSSPVTDPRPDAGSNANRVLRGGHWNNSLTASRSSHRVDGTPSFTSDSFGVRPARRLTP